ncbi:MAG: hypothetical protein ACM3VT_19735 [Solirubrobacterales bacterium]
MKPIRNIEKAIKNQFRVAAGRALHDRVLRRIRQADAEFNEPATALSRPVIRRMIMRSFATRVAAIALICIGAGVVTAVAVTAAHYYYLGKDDTGHHRFDSTDGQSMVTMDDAPGMDPEQARRDIEEMKSLSEQGRRELVKVVRIDVNGELERKMLVYKYSLADGSTREIGEIPPGNTGRGTLTGPQHTELMRLKDAGPGKDLGSYEEDILGRAFAFTRQQYTLSDGTEIIWSAGTPKTAP